MAQSSLKGKRERLLLNSPKRKTARFGKGTPIRGQAREMVYSLRAYFELERQNEGPLIDVNKVLERTAAALNISRNTVINSGKEKCEKEKEDGKPSGPSDSLLETPGKANFILPPHINLEPDLKKQELMDLANMYKPRIPIYAIDKLAKRHGHSVIRFPPYHAHLYPTEHIWTQEKNYVARINKKFTIAEAERLTREGIQEVNIIILSNETSVSSKKLRNAKC
ncbi:hypothetical protein ANN_09885 [Periplaneta americana]|uniref:Uncharacterized protein n=1 Tax=Periplaneta americana TaxID=6978 RepID=A0ABQ8TP13_PERAM|nr:hypothetical protein ANN_09885 [Periplaneta americana]